MGTSYLVGKGEQSGRVRAMKIRADFTKGDWCARGFDLEARPFVPHLTLSRNIERPFGRVPIEPISWDAVAVALVRSESGTGRYTTFEAWALGKTGK